MTHTKSIALAITMLFSTLLYSQCPNPPEVNCENLSIELDNTGNASITPNDLVSFEFVFGEFFTTPPRRTYLVSTGDLDGDGDSDIFLGSSFVGGRILFNDGTGSFNLSPQNFPDHARYTNHLIDVDGDNDLDIAYHDGVTSFIRIYKNDGTGTFSDTGQGFGSSRKFEFGDIDGDSDLDILEGTSNLWLNDGSGFFTLSPNSVSGVGVAGKLVDIDNDGDLDAIAGEVFKNDGTGVFTSTGQAFFSATWNSEIEAGDLDGDGDMDLIAANTGNIYLNDGTGIFTLNSTIPKSLFMIMLELADLDGDGDLDLIYPDGAGSGANELWLNDGNAQFSFKQEMSTQFNEDVAIADFDLDGDLDAYFPDYRNAPSNFIWFNEVGYNAACGVSSLTTSQTTFTCADQGINIVEITLVDDAGNSATCAAEVEVTIPGINFEFNLSNIVIWENAPVSLSTALAITDGDGNALPNAGTYDILDEDGNVVQSGVSEIVAMDLELGGQYFLKYNYTGPETFICPASGMHPFKVLSLGCSN